MLELYLYYICSPSTSTAITTITTTEDYYWLLQGVETQFDLVIKCGVHSLTAVAISAFMRGVQ